MPFANWPCDQVPLILWKTYSVDVLPLSMMIWGWLSESVAMLGLDPENRPLMAGIYHEHLAFVRALRGEEPASSTLSATLQTQVIREEFKKVIDAGEKTSVIEVSF